MKQKIMNTLTLSILIILLIPYTYAALVPDPILYTRLDGNATDEYGNYDGTLHNLVENTTHCKLGTCMMWDDDQDYIDFGVGVGNHLGAMTDYTFSCWIKNEAPHIDQGILYFGSLAPQIADFTLYSDAFGTMDLRYAAGHKISDAQNNKDWHHVLLRSDGSDVEFWVDGALKDTDTYFNVDVTGDKYIIGAYYAPAYAFTGNIDECGVWNVSLSDSEIGNLYNSGTPLDVDSFNSSAPPSKVSIRVDNATDQFISRTYQGTPMSWILNVTNSTGHNPIDWVCTLNLSNNTNVSVPYNASRIAYEVVIKRNDPGVETATASCIGTTETASNTSSISIKNYPPIVGWGGITNGAGLQQPPLIEYTTGTWTLLPHWNDTDPSYFKIVLSNSTKTISTNTSPIEWSINIEHENFLLFAGNPYNFSVWMNDTNNTGTFFNVSFNITDTNAPSCSSWLSGTGFLIDNNTDFNKSYDCVDSAFYYFNMSCTNSYIKEYTGITTAYNSFINFSSVTNPFNCSWFACDGHTADFLPQDFKFQEKGNSVVVNYKSINVFSGGTKTNLHATIQEKDRINFVFMPKEKQLGEWCEDFTYQANLKSKYVESDMYKGWIIDTMSLTWFDSEIQNDPHAKVTVKRNNWTHYNVKVCTDQPNMTFSSIGVLNCISGIFYVSIATNSDEYEYGIDTDKCPDTIEGVLLLFGVFCLCFAFIIMGAVIDPIFGVFGGLLLFFMCFAVYWCSPIIALIVALVGLLSMFLFFMQN